MDKQDLVNHPYININHHISATRCYYIHRLKYYFIYTAGMDEYTPVKIDTAIQASEYLYDVLKDSPISDLSFVHPNTMKPKLEHLLGDDQDLTKKILYEFLLLLL